MNKTKTKKKLNFISFSVLKLEKNLVLVLIQLQTKL